METTFAKEQKTPQNQLSRPENSVRSHTSIQRIWSSPWVRSVCEGIQNLIKLISMPQTLMNSDWEMGNISRKTRFMNPNSDWVSGWRGASKIEPASHSEVVAMGAAMGVVKNSWRTITVNRNGKCQAEEWCILHVICGNWISVRLEKDIQMHWIFWFKMQLQVISRMF